MILLWKRQSYAWHTVNVHRRVNFVIYSFLPQHIFGLFENTCTLRMHRSVKLLQLYLALEATNKIRSNCTLFNTVDSIMDNITFLFHVVHHTENAQMIPFYILLDVHSTAPVLE